MNRNLNYLFVYCTFVPAENSLNAQPSSMRKRYRQFMFDFNNLPARQKILIGLTLLVGLFLIICASFNLITPDRLNNFIFYYSLGVPLILLTFDTLIDLNEKNVFMIWLTLGIIMFIVSLFTLSSDKFKISRSARFDNTSTFNSLISDISTSSLKTLLLFLVAYWLLNKLILKTRGVYLVNTFWKTTWYHNLAKRKIYGDDVLWNILLLIVIVVGALFKF